MTTIKVNRPQGRFLSLPHKFRAFVSGYGGGKTWCGAIAMCLHYHEHPGINQGYFAPTYPQIRDIFYPTIEEVSSACGLSVQIREANKEVHFYSGARYVGTTICRSMERPHTIVGFKIGNAMVDEFDVLEPSKAELSWRKIIARMRYNDAGIKNGVDVTTTPEGFRYTHKLFVSAVLDNPILASLYGIVQASTLDNEANLPADYVRSLRDTYPSALIDAYINGRFVNLKSGTVYRSYDRVRCSSDESIKFGETLYIGMDFNVTRMAATIYVIRDKIWHAVDELKDIFDTPDMIAAISSRYSGHRVIVYPDASGASRKSVNAQSSDIALLRQARFDVRCNSTNPAVRDRITAANKMFESGALRINSKACPTVARCLESQIYDDNGEPDKSGGNDHQNDATTYPIAYEHPIIAPMRRIAIGGF